MCKLSCLIYEDLCPCSKLYTPLKKSHRQPLFFNLLYFIPSKIIIDYGSIRLIINWTVDVHVRRKTKTVVTFSHKDMLELNCCLLILRHEDVFVEMKVKYNNRKGQYKKVIQFCAEKAIFPL